jgi:hypothetical protein
LLIKPSKKLDWNRRPVRNLPHEWFICVYVQ